MHKYHKMAEDLTKETIDGLERIISTSDGEDISYYNLSAFDEYINNLIRVRTFMACANESIEHDKVNNG